MPSPIEKIKQLLESDFPEVVIEFHKADDASGFQFLSALSGDFEVAAEWKPNGNIGVSAFDASASSMDALYSPPDEWYARPEAAYHRIASLLLEKRETRPPVLKVAEVRHERRLTQEELSKKLRITQASYSKLERRGTVTIMALSKVIEAMGGKLRIQAIFPDTQDVRELTFK